LSGPGWDIRLCRLAVIAVDVMYDEQRVEDAIFFAVVYALMVVIVAFTRWMTGVVLRRLASRTASDLTPDGVRA
jgi:hypothetical protein